MSAAAWRCATCDADAASACYGCQQRALATRPAAQRRGPSQRARVLAALQRAGSHGVTQLDFAPPVCDGLAPILRIASRVAELRAAGYAVVARRERTPGGAVVARYVIAAPEPTRPNGGQEGEPEQLGLGVSVAITHRPASPYEADVDGDGR